MAISYTSTHPNAIRIRYLHDYTRSAERRRLYDQVALGVDEFSRAASDADTMAKASHGGTVRFNFLSDMTPGTTAISETADISPQTLREATADITVNMYGEGIQVAEKLMLQAYTNYGIEKAEKVGLNMMESVDNLALEAALNGSLSLVAGSATRATLDAGSATQRATDALLWRVSGRLQEMHVPGFLSADSKDVTWPTITHPNVVQDIVTNSSGNILNVAQYQRDDLILNQEIGRLGPYRIVSSGDAKVFLGAGAANASDVDTTLSAAVNALSKTIVVTANTNIAAGDILNIIAAKESSTTFYPTNERVVVASVSGTTITIVGMGDNGGLRWDHASGAIVNADDSAYTLLVAGPRSLAKVWAPTLGVYGEMVGPLKQGLLHQWESLGWKWYGGYGRPVEKWLYRIEVSSSNEA